MLLRCINARSQPRLTQGAVYDLVLDVEHSTRPGEDGNKAGYLVKVHDGDMAIPFLYRRNRFVEHTMDPGDDEPHDEDS